MANCGRYRQVSGIGSLWKCSGVKLWTIHSLAVWKPFWKTMESASWDHSVRIYAICIDYRCPAAQNHAVKIFVLRADRRMF